MRVLLPLRTANSDNDSSDDGGTTTANNNNNNNSGQSNHSLASEKSAPAALGRGASEGDQPIFFIAGSDDEAEERLTKSVSLSYIPSILLEEDENEADNRKNIETRSGLSSEPEADKSLSGAKAKEGALVPTGGAKKILRSQSTPQLGLDLESLEEQKGHNGPKKPAQKSLPSWVPKSADNGKDSKLPALSKLASRPSVSCLDALASAATPAPAPTADIAAEKPTPPAHNLRKRKLSATRASTENDRKPPASQSKRPAVAKKPPPASVAGGSAGAVHLNPASQSARNSSAGCSNCVQAAAPINNQTNGKRPASAMVGVRRAGSGPWRRSQTGTAEDESRDSTSVWNDSGYRYTMVASSRDETEDPLSSLARRDGEDEPITASQMGQFCMALKAKGLEIKEQEGDGNCLFRAVSLQIYGDASMHGDVRRKCMDFMERDREHFSQFLAEEPFDQYIARKRLDGVHGNNPELQAISELFNRPVEVFCPENGATPLNIFQAEYKTNDVPIRLSYHDGNHYNAVVDPLVPTAGLGLGLPGLQPGLADKMQMAKAVAESDAAADQAALKRAMKDSEEDELQRALKESSLSVEHMYNNQAMNLSDMDATYLELEQAALEHSMQSSYPSLEQGQKQKASSSRRRRSDRASPSHQPEYSADTHVRDQPPPSAAVASLPTSHNPPPAAAAAVPASSVASVPKAARSPSPHIRDPSDYPSSVQELAMNGFDFKKVVRAYELVGDNFDSILSLLMNGQ